ncbi:hypothetical protein C8N35_107160 [Breoghania corrubedonensis]|uniref:Uncharacterized protein n=1 Tax=Breoghania corrubedonensis TaxID=665038 RepID=A0A2T5V6U6_9HYPH|nr:hypothetical protein C8N35_107160 [Breoghania corrubedonensis]
MYDIVLPIAQGAGDLLLSPPLWGRCPAGAEGGERQARHLPPAPLCRAERDISPARGETGARGRRSRTRRPAQIHPTVRANTSARAKENAPHAL